MKRELHPFAAIFSLALVGFGQILKGESKRGLKWLLWFYLGIPCIIYASFMINAYLFIFVLAISVVIIPVFWTYNILDALLA